MFDFEEEVIDLLKNEWNPASTAYGELPVIGSGWIEDDNFDLPSVMVLESTEAPQGGGETGFTGMSGDGRPMTRVIGDQPILCVTHERMEDLGDHPKRVSKEMKEEIKRIISAHYFEPFGPIHWMSFFSSSSITDGTRRPIWFRNDCLIRYGYDHRMP